MVAMKGQNKQPVSSWLCCHQDLRACDCCLMGCRMLAFLLIPAEVCTHHEQLKEHQGKSEPLFLVYRVSSKQVGLAEECTQHTPTSIRQLNGFLLLHFLTGDHMLRGRPRPAQSSLIMQHGSRWHG